MTPDLALSLLHRAGFSVGVAAFHGPEGTSWLVSGNRAGGEDVIRATGKTEAQAWQRAVEQARLRDDTPGGRLV